MSRCWFCTHSAAQWMNNHKSETLFDLIILHPLLKPLTRKKTQTIIEVLDNAQANGSLSLSFFLRLSLSLFLVLSLSHSLSLPFSLYPTLFTFTTTYVRNMYIWTNMWWNDSWENYWIWITGPLQSSQDKVSKGCTSSKHSGVLLLPSPPCSLPRTGSRWKSPKTCTPTAGLKNVMLDAVVAGNPPSICSTCIVALVRYAHHVFWTNLAYLGELLKNRSIPNSTTSTTSATSTTSSPADPKKS